MRAGVRVQTGRRTEQTAPVTSKGGLGFNHRHTAHAEFPGLTSITAVDEGRWLDWVSFPPMKEENRGKGPSRQYHSPASSSLCPPTVGPSACSRARRPAPWSGASQRGSCCSSPSLHRHPSRLRRLETALGSCRPWEPSVYWQE